MASKAPARGHGNKSNPVKKNLCFACGKDNPHGMHLKFFLDRERNHFVCHFRLSKRRVFSSRFCSGSIRISQ